MGGVLVDTDVLIRAYQARVDIHQVHHHVTHSVELQT